MLHIGKGKTHCHFIKENYLYKVQLKLAKNWSEHE